MVKEYYFNLIKIRDRLNFVSKQYYTALLENDRDYIEILGDEVIELIEKSKELQHLFFKEIKKRDSEINQIEWRLNQLQNDKNLGGVYALEIVLLKQRLSQLGVKIN